MTIISEDIVSKVENDLTMLRMKINPNRSPIEKVICVTFSLTDFLYNVQSVERAVKVTSEALRLVYGQEKQHDFIIPKKKDPKKFHQSRFLLIDVK